MDISDDFRDNLKQELNNLQSTLSITMQIYALCASNYNNSMQKSLDEVEYYRPDEFMNRHEHVKNQSMTQV